MIEFYKSEDGKLTVEKRDSYPVTTFSDIPREKATLNASRMIETAFTYQQPGYTVLEKNNKGKCDICGIETEYSNRHVCPYCWGRFESEILSALKEATEKEDISV